MFRQFYLRYCFRDSESGQVPILLYPDLFHRKSQAVYNLQMFALVAQLSQRVLLVQGRGKYAVRPVTPFHTTLGHMVLFYVQVLWQALKGMLIRGLLILLGRSVQPSAQKKGVTGLAFACGSSAPAIMRISCWH